MPFQAVFDRGLKAILYQVDSLDEILVVIDFFNTKCLKVDRILNKTSSDGAFVTRDV